MIVYWILEHIMKLKGEKQMISTAVQRGNFVYVYNERNSQTASIAGELYGFTSTTVSVKRGDFVYVYNERGSQVSSHFCK